MVGRDASAFYNRESVAPGEVVFEAKDISGKGVSAASFKVRRGEIVGFAGMVGSGRSELMDILLSLIHICRGVMQGSVAIAAFVSIFSLPPPV